jgi:hypothetical protein
MKETKLTTFANQFRHEKFDASNVEHIKAYAYMQNHGRLHPTLRFPLEDGHLSVPIMMAERLAAAYISTFKDLTKAVAKDVASKKYTSVA